MPFEIPEDLAVLDDDALAAAIEAALTEAAEFNEVPDADLDDEKLNRLIALADFATAAKAEQGTRGEAAAERSERAQAARAALTRPEPAAEDVVDAEIVEDEKVDEPEQKKEPAPVAASAARKVPVVARAGAAAANAPVDIAPARPTPVLTASADVPGFSTGGALPDLDSVGKAMLARMKGLPTARLGGQQGVQQRYSVAQIDVGANRTDGLTQSGSGDDQSLVAAAAREARLPGGSLTAAGGWCAPSETLYDLCSIESTDGLLDIPSVTVNRGGIRYTKGPDFADLYAKATGWWLTEAEVIAGGEKPCVTIDCPPFVEVRLDAIGLCITAPLLTQAAYPELVRRWIEGLVVAHQHVVDAAIIAKIVAGSTALNAAGDFANTIDSLAELEQVGNYKRQQWRMPFAETMEVLAPYWYKTVVRADLARRTGIDLINVNDATIEAYFTARKMRVQWLYNYLPLTTNVAETQVLTPDTVDLVMYPAGTWIKGTTDVISLDAVYDSTNLALNQYTALFAEEGVLVANTCYDSVLVTISTCANGETGAAALDTCVLGSA